MTRVHPKCYIGDLAAPLLDAIKRSISLETPYPQAVFITISVNRLEQLDIVRSEMYFSPLNKRRGEIVGIAFGKPEALKLVKKIAADVYRNDPECNIRKAFENRQGD